MALLTSNVHYTGVLKGRRRKLGCYFCSFLGKQRSRVRLVGPSNRMMLTILIVPIHAMKENACNNICKIKPHCTFWKSRQTIYVFKIIWHLYIFLIGILPINHIPAATKRMAVKMRAVALQLSILSCNNWTSLLLESHYKSYFSFLLLWVLIFHFFFPGAWGTGRAYLEMANKWRGRHVTKYVNWYGRNCHRQWSQTRLHRVKTNKIYRSLQEVANGNFSLQINSEYLIQQTSAEADKYWLGKKMINEKWRGTCVANTRSSPIAKRTRKTYRLLKQKAAKQNTAPNNVANDRSYTHAHTKKSWKQFADKSQLYR